MGYWELQSHKSDMKYKYKSKKMQKLHDDDSKFKLYFLTTKPIPIN